MEKREKKRFLKRLFVRFGKEAMDHCGFTHDLSFKGIFITSSFSFPPGTRLMLDITLPDDRVIRLFGSVRWAKRTPPALSRVIRKHGMGIDLLEVPGEYVGLIEGFRSG